MNKNSDQDYKKNILIVDDDSTIRLMTKAIIEKAGYVAHEVDNGEDALTQFDKLKPDAILLDVGLPGIDGFEVCEGIRKSPYGEYIPIMMITGHDDIESIDRAYHVDATDFLTKPITWAVLAHKLKYLMRASYAFSELHRNKTRLDNAKKVARISEWEYDLNTLKFVCSEEIYKLFNFEKNKNLENLNNLDESENLYLKNYEDLIKQAHPHDRKRIKKCYTRLKNNFINYDIEYRILNGDKTKYIQEQAQAIQDNNGNHISLLGTIKDITKRKEIEEEVRYLAYFDSLTGLPNRALFNEHLITAIAKAEREGSKIAILFLDLDNFKRVNDSFGHDAGDRLLKIVSDQLIQSLRRSDYISTGTSGEIIPAVSRLGGDEFIILLHHNVSAKGASYVAKRIINILNRPVMIENHEVPISVSIGISIFPDDGHDASNLLKNADAAMYSAKEIGKNTYRFYNSKMNELAIEKLQLEADLQKALQTEQLVLYYQPKVNLKSNKIVATEALLRWKHPELGLLSPTEFIPIAENSNLIIPIGEWVLKEACKTTKELQEKGSSELHVAVNLSAKQFVSDDLVQTVSDILKETDFTPHCLELELTEGMIMENKPHTLDTLNKLKKLGVRISIDDFGTGYSSLRYLSQFPLDAIKIDKSFVKKLPFNKNDAMISEAIIELAHRLNLEVIAEGVEREEQIEFFRNKNCDTIQGFLISNPLDKTELRKLLDSY